MAVEVLGLDWRAIFVPSQSLAELVLRGTLMYVGLFVLLRVILKRQSGGLSITDVLVVVLIADAAQNGMAGEYRSVTEGLILVTAILFWSFSLDWLGYRFPAVQRLLEAPPLLLVENGNMLRRNMRRELITPDDLLTAIREKGVADLSQVQRAYMEPDGHISVIKKG